MGKGRRNWERTTRPTTERSGIGTGEGDAGKKKKNAVGRSPLKNGAQKNPKCKQLKKNNNLPAKKTEVSRRRGKAILAGEKKTDRKGVRKGIQGHARGGGGRGSQKRESSFPERRHDLSPSGKKKNVSGKEKRRDHR